MSASIAQRIKHAVQIAGRMCGCKVTPMHNTLAQGNKLFLTPSDPRHIGFGEFLLTIVEDGGPH